MNSKFNKGLFFQIFFVVAGLFLIITGVITLFIPLDKVTSQLLRQSIFFPGESGVPTEEETKWLLSRPIFRFIIGGGSIIVGLYFCKISALFRKLKKDNEK